MNKKRNVPDCPNPPPPPCRSAIPFRASEAFAPADAERTELEHLRKVKAKRARLMPAIEQLLAAQGDAPDRDLLRLQHELADLLRPSGSPAAEHSTQA
jgi:hypothetical protein